MKQTSGLSSELYGYIEPVRVIEQEGFAFVEIVTSKQADAAMKAQIRANMKRKTSHRQGTAYATPHRFWWKLQILGCNA